MSCNCSEILDEVHALRNRLAGLEKAHGLVADDVRVVQYQIEQKASQHDLQSYVDDLPEAGALGDLYVELVDTLRKHGIELDVRSLRHHRANALRRYRTVSA